LVCSSEDDRLLGTPVEGITMSIVFSEADRTRGICKRYRSIITVREHILARQRSDTSLIISVVVYTT
jgi:hypothetical protein